jgi:hypothetical protein
MGGGEPASDSSRLSSTKAAISSTGSSKLIRGKESSVVEASCNSVKQKSDENREL